MSDGNIIQFASYLSDLWEGVFHHRYAISRHPSWDRWRDINDSVVQSVWHCHSLSQAADHYSWTGSDAALHFNDLSLQIRTSVQNADEISTHDLCIAVFKWGGVGRRPDDKSVLWLRSQLEDGRLTTRLKDACALLKDNEADLARFDGQDLLMNSAMTKVYAALSPSELIIYDGRVGAALGLLAKDYLRSINHRGPVPELLAFPWGASQGKHVPGQQNKRNPSDEEFHFPGLFGARQDKLHAEMMRNTSCLLRLVDRQISEAAASNLTRLEQALFMIGYDVSRALPAEES